jgi:hypothetical protein
MAEQLSLLAEPSRRTLVVRRAVTRRRVTLALWASLERVAAGLVNVHGKESLDGERLTLTDAQRAALYRLSDARGRRRCRRSAKRKNLTV